MPFVLAPRHRAVVRAFGEALFAYDGGPRPAQLDALVEGVTEHLGPVSRVQRTLLLLALELVRWLPLLLLTWPGTFPSMPLPRRIALLERMDRSKAMPLLMPLVAFKTILCMHFFEDESELRAMGYPGDDRTRWLRTVS
jgi:hypothetical protein